jgi:hypothetical protein
MFYFVLSFILQSSVLCSSVVAGSGLWQDNKSGHESGVEKSYLFQPVELNEPERGSIAGSHGETEFDAQDLTRGEYQLSIGIDFPEKLGKPLIDFAPSYIPSSGLSEWGMGIKTSLSIKRTHPGGQIDYQTDEWSSPWGKLKKGSDGYFYPQGINQRIRFLDQGDTWIAYHPDGMTTEFKLLTQSTKGAYEFFATRVTNRDQRETRLSYEVLSDNFVYLKDVQYGGWIDQPHYQVNFEYEQILRPYTTYVSAQKQTLTKRVKSIKILGRTNEGRFIPQYHFDLNYTDLENSLAFYLAQITKTWDHSAQSEPAIRLSFRTGISDLLSAQWQKNQKLNSLLKDWGGAGYLDGSKSTLIDSDRSGRNSFEVASEQYALYQQTETGYQKVKIHPNFHNQRSTRCVFP